jgi:hypothetical protein
MVFLPLRRFSLDTALTPAEVALALAPHLRRRGPAPHLRGVFRGGHFRLEPRAGRGDYPGPLVRAHVDDRPWGSRVRVALGLDVRAAWPAMVVFALALWFGPLLLALLFAGGRAGNACSLRLGAPEPVSALDPFFSLVRGLCSSDLVIAALLALQAGLFFRHLRARWPTRAPSRPGFEARADAVEHFLRDLLPSPAAGGGGPFRSPGRR